MLRSTLAPALRPAFRQNTVKALFSTSVQMRAEGATGSGESRPGGAASGDAFTKREKANEDYSIKQREREKLLALKAKIAEQKKHLEELDKSLEDFTSDK